MKRWKSAEFGAKRLSPEIQTKQHCRLIVPRSSTLIGTAPDAARYSRARVLVLMVSSSRCHPLDKRREARQAASMEKNNLPGLSPLWLILLALVLGSFLATALPLIVLSKDVLPADWLGFSGGIIGSACTIGAGWLAYSAVQEQIEIAKREAKARRIAELTEQVGREEVDLDRMALTRNYLRAFAGNFDINMLSNMSSGMTRQYRGVRWRADDFVSSTAAQAPYGYGERVLTVMNRIAVIGNRIQELSGGNEINTAIEAFYDDILLDAVKGIDAIADQIEADIPIYQNRWLPKFQELQTLRD
jgi:hypothetical protein